MAGLSGGRVAQPRPRRDDEHAIPADVEPRDVLADAVSDEVSRYANSSNRLRRRGKPIYGDSKDDE